MRWLRDSVSLQAVHFGSFIIILYDKNPPFLLHRNRPFLTSCTFLRSSFNARDNQLLFSLCSLLLLYLRKQLALFFAIRWHLWNEMNGVRRASSGAVIDRSMCSRLLCALGKRSHEIAGSARV